MAEANEQSNASSNEKQGKAAVITEDDKIDEWLYERAAFARARSAHELQADDVTFTKALSLPALRRHNLASVAGDLLICAAGNFVLSIDLVTGAQSHIAGVDGKGIGSIALHPNGRFFAIGEAGAVPNCYVMEYVQQGRLDGSTVKRVLRNGTSRVFTSLRFSPEGTRLATVGGAPDYLLTVWDWTNERIILRNKAFSQEVFDVSFSKRLEGRLVTCGVGHIRFWVMANTFTGLKLQGQIGKFGNEDIADVPCHAELPGGNILSGNELGRMHLWEGNLIKVPFVSTDGSNVHEGSIEVMQVLAEQNCILTAGADGMIQYWDLQQVSDAELEEDADEFRISPIASYTLGSGISVRNLVHSEGSLVAQNAQGSFDRLSLPEHNRHRILSFHADSINAIVPCSVNSTFLTCGNDGSVRGYNCDGFEHTCARWFGASANAMVSVPGQHGKDVAVGFSDGAVRFLRRCADGIKLLGTVKPSDVPVRMLAFSPNNQWLATVSEDETVFFFDCTKRGERITENMEPSFYEPVAYADLYTPSSKTLPLCCTWTHASTALLVGLSQDGIVAVQPPEKSTLSASTYKAEVTQAVYPFHRTFHVQVDDEEASESNTQQNFLAEDSSGVAASIEQSSTKKSNVDSAEAEDEEDKDPKSLALDEDRELDASQQQEEDHASTKQRIVHEKPFPVLCMQRDIDERDTLLVGAGGNASGCVLKCRLDSPDCVAHSFNQSFERDVTTLQTICSGAFIASGSTDGTVQIEPRKGELRGCPWHENVHGEMDGGRVQAIAMSYNAAYLITASADGNLFLSSLSKRLQKLAIEEETYEEYLTKYSNDPSSEATDIPNDSLSIEQAKQKAESDYLQRKAEERKRTVREQVEEIQKEFWDLVKENESLPEEIRVPREQLSVDGGLDSYANEQTQYKIEQVQDEMHHENERCRRRLEKMQQVFIQPMKSERFRLHAFQNGRNHFVCTSFRVPELSATMKRDIHAAKQNVLGKSSSGRLRSMSRGSEHDHKSSPQQQQQEPQHFSHQQHAAHGDDGIDEKSLTKEEVRSLRRRRRELEWESFLARKPEGDYEDPEDVRAIEDAKKNMGDFKLKSDPKYIASHEERVNTDKKKDHLLLLEDHLQSIKEAFNAKLQELHKVKEKIVKEIGEGNQRVLEINNELELEGGTTHVSMHEDENPTEQRDLITDQHLAQYEDELRASGKIPRSTERIINEERLQRSCRNFSSTHPTANGLHHRSSSEGSKHGIGLRKALRRNLARSNGVPSLEREERDENAREAYLRHERDRIIHRAKEMMSSFDDALDQLRREKFKVESDIKAADLKRIVFIQELQLLKEFEKRDNSLQNKYDNKLGELQDLDKRLSESQSKLDTRYQEVERLQDAKRQVGEEFEELVDENHPFREPLLRAFNRKIKRNKKEDQDDDDDETDEEESELNEDESDEESDEGEDDVAPPGCDQTLFEKVCDLRERKLDQDDGIVEVQKSMEALRKEIDTIQKKERNVQTQLDGIEREVEDFQREKQGKLNEIDVSVLLKAEQVKWIRDPNTLPSLNELTKGLVFHNDALSRLRHRIDEIAEEKKQLKHENLELKKQHKQLQHDRQKKEARIAEMEQKAHEVQMLKFGQTIDLEKVHRMGKSKNVEDLEQQLQRLQKEQVEEQKQWDKAIEEAQQELDRLTQENTQKVESIVNHTSQQQQLEEQVSQNKKQLFNDPIATKRAEAEERDRLVETVNSQADTLEELRTSIAHMNRYGTSLS